MAGERGPALRELWRSLLAEKAHVKSLEAGDAIAAIEGSVGLCVGEVEPLSLSPDASLDDDRGLCGGDGGAKTVVAGAWCG